MMYGGTIWTIGHVGEARSTTGPSFAPRTGTPVPIVFERTQTWEADVREAHSSPGVSALATTSSFAEGNRERFGDGPEGRPLYVSSSLTPRPSRSAARASAMRRKNSG